MKILGIETSCDETAAAVSSNWSDAWTVFGNVDGTQYGVPVKSDLKSLVWYQPARFEADGYSVPETFDDFVALVEEMAAAGGPKPLCIGIESGQATGWTFTDWVEDMVLRQHGPDVYDQWVSHDIPFNDDRIVGTMQTVLDLWTEDNVFAAGGSIAAGTVVNAAASATSATSCRLPRVCRAARVLSPRRHGNVA